MKHATPSTARSVTEIHARMKAALPDEPRACEWVEPDEDGFMVCKTRRDLKNAVVAATREPSGPTRTERYEEAKRAHDEHFCERPPRRTTEGGDSDRGVQRTPDVAVGESVEKPKALAADVATSPAGPPITLAIRAYAEAVENRVTDRSEAARDRVGEAYVALLEAIEEYRERGKRRLTDILEENERGSD
jgi:hypothetical protein